MKGNYLVLNDEQLKLLNDKYLFSIVENGILVKTKNYDRVVYHTFDEPFPVILQTDEKKYTFKITKRAIELWLKNNNKNNYSLIDIQNFINKTIVSSQAITDEMIEANMK